MRAALTNVVPFQIYGALAAAWRYGRNAAYLNAVCWEKGMPLAQARSTKQGAGEACEAAVLGEAGRT